MKRKLLASFALALLVVATAHAQSFTIDWFTVDGGGGTSTGGVYSVSGTIGQPDAGTMAGGIFALSGGFWGLYGIQSPNPSLSIRRLGPNAVLSWPISATGFTLEYIAQLAPTGWTTESVAIIDTATEHTVTVPANSGRRFYRLRK